MTRITAAKLTLALVGIGIFFTGVRLDNDVLRWIGIGCAAVAWTLRFVERGVRRRAEAAADAVAESVDQGPRR
jgi:hypothetical protein